MGKGYIRVDGRTWAVKILNKDDLDNQDWAKCPRCGLITPFFRRDVVHHKPGSGTITCSCGCVFTEAV